MDNRLRRLGKESVVYGLGGAISKFIGFLLLPLYTRLFSPADYGTLDVIVTVTSLAGIVLTAGMETALSYYFFRLEDPAERRRTITTAAAYLFGMNAAVAAVIWAFATPLTATLFGGAENALYLRVAILALPFSSLVTLNLNLLRLSRKPWRYLSLSIPHLLTTVAFNLYFVAWLRVGVIGVFYTNVIAAVAFAIVGLAVNRGLFGLVVSLPRLRQLLRYGLPLVIGGLSMWSINYLDRYFLLRYSSLEEIGQYAVGLRIASLIAFVTTAFRTANAPFQFEVSANDDAPAVYSRTLTYYVLLTSVLCVAVALFARPLLSLLATEQYFGAARVVALASFSAVAYGLYQIVSVGLLVTKRTGLVGMATGAGAAVNVLYLFMLVPSLGIFGAALATLMTHLTVVGILFVAAQRQYAIPYDLGRVARTVVTAATLIVAGSLIQPGRLLEDSAIAAGFLLLFLCSVPLLSLLERSDWRMIQGRLVRLAGIPQRQA